MSYLRVYPSQTHYSTICSFSISLSSSGAGYCAARGVSSETCANAVLRPSLTKTRITPLPLLRWISVESKIIPRFVSGPSTAIGTQFTHHRDCRPPGTAAAYPACPGREPPKPPPFRRQVVPPLGEQ